MMYVEFEGNLYFGNIEHDYITIISEGWDNKFCLRLSEYLILTTPEAKILYPEYFV